VIIGTVNEHFFPRLQVAWDFLDWDPKTLEKQLQLMGGHQTVDLDDQGDDGVDGVHEFLVSHTGDSKHFGLGGTVFEADAPSTLAGAYEGVVLRLFRREGSL